QQRMAAWNLVGSFGAVIGPLLLAGVLALGGGWRPAYLLLAGARAVTLGPAPRAGPAWRAPGPAQPAQTPTPSPRPRPPPRRRAPPPPPRPAPPPPRPPPPRPPPP